MSVITFIPEILKKITIPPGDYDAYDREWLVMVPLTYFFSFCFLMGFFGNWIAYPEEEERE